MTTLQVEQPDSRACALPLEVAIASACCTNTLTKQEEKRHFSKQNGVENRQAAKEGIAPSDHMLFASSVLVAVRLMLHVHYDYLITAGNTMHAGIADWQHIIAATTPV